MALLKSWLSRLWVGLVVGFVAWFLYRYPEQVDLAIVGSIPLPAYAASFLLIVVGKILTIRLVSFSLAQTGQTRPFMFSWWAYSSSDLAKYLPGGIWGISTRLFLYREHGISLPDATRSFLLESVVIVLASGGIGLGLVAGSLGLVPWIAVVAGYGLLLGAGYLVLGAMLRSLSRPEILRCLIEQSVAWILFGISFSLLFTMTPWSLQGWRLAGFFDIAFASGFVAFFAPSGIGVREAVLGIAAKSTGTDVVEVVQLALIHRIVWAVADIAVFLPAWLHRSRSGRTKTVS